MMKLILALGLCFGICTAVRADGPNYDKQLPFEFGRDTLCFENYHLKSGPWPLKQIGAKYGVCQGMVAAARAFRNHARFTCSGSRPSASRAESKIRKVMRLHAGGCSGTVDIEGYCSLDEFCRDHREALEWTVTRTNADLAISPLLGYVLDFKDGPTRKAQTRNMAAINQIFDELNAGNTPLLAVPWHVVMVLGMKFERASDGDYRVELNIYDPNHNDKAVTWSYVIDSSFRHTVGAEPMFVMSPYFYQKSRSCGR